MPRPCAMLSVQLSPTPTTRAAAKAIAAPRRAATSSSSNATIVLPSTGTSRVSSSVTCVWTIICQFVTSVRLGMSHRRASCATCSIKRSTRSDRSRRRSRSVATQTPGSKFFRLSRASTSKARSTVVPTIGRSGAGIVSAPKKLSKPSGQRHKRSGPGHLGHPHHPARAQARPSAAQDPGVQRRAAQDPAVQPREAQVVRSVVAQARAQAAQPRADRGVADLAVHSAAVRALRVPTVQPRADHVLQDPAAARARPGHAQAGPRGARVDQPIHANLLSRSISRGSGR